MEPRASRDLPEGPSFIYQVKWDGMRLLAFWDGSRLKLKGKNLKDKTASYPEMGILPELVKARSFLLDGELIALKEGKPSFFTLMQRENSLAQREASLSRIPVYYMVFDLLLMDGAWLLARPWESRQELLHGALEGHVPLVHRTESYADGQNLLEVVAEKEMEGIVAKKKDSPYVPGPRKSSCWIKTKLLQTLSAGVGGIYLKGGKPVSLLLGLEDEGRAFSGNGQNKVRFIGSVSSGLSEDELYSWLQWGMGNPLAAPPFFNPPPAQPGRDIIWAKPDRRLQVSFSEWTPGLKLRFPRIKHFVTGEE